MRVITLEDHFATPMFQEKFPQGNVPGHFLADRGRYLGYDISAELLNLGDSRLAAMDAAGIDLQVVSLTMPGCEGFEGETAIAMATDANDRLAQAIRTHPTRLAGFASLPTANPAAAAKELERAVTKLGFKGALINGHVRGEFLDDRKYWVIFECAQALNVPIYLHPTIPHPAVLKAYFEGYVELATPAWGFAMDTCTHFLRLVFSGLFDACPNLKMILGHLGEGLAVLDSSPERPHSIRRQTAGFEKVAGAIPERESGGHDERQLFRARFLMHPAGAGRRQRPFLG